MRYAMILCMMQKLGIKFGKRRIQESDLEKGSEDVHS
jgi:hypothetical protein